MLNDITLGEVLSCFAQLNIGTHIYIGGDVLGVAEVKKKMQ